MLDYQCAGFGIKRLDVKMAMSNFAACAMATVAGCQSSWSATARAVIRYAPCGQRTEGALLWKSRRVCWWGRLLASSVNKKRTGIRRAFMSFQVLKRYSS